jgi:hypothetical protein
MEDEDDDEGNGDEKVEAEKEGNAIRWSFLPKR